MTEKRFEYHSDGFLMEWISDNSDHERVSCKCAVELLNEFVEENEQLKKENNMLKITIGRNEAYINQLTNKEKWTN